MAWKHLRQSMREFDQVLDDLNVRIGDDAPVAPQLATVRRFHADHAALSEEALLGKWKNERFREFHDAAIVVHRLTEAVAALRDQPRGELRKRLKQVLSGTLTQDFSPQQAKDFLFELEVAHLLQKAGFTVALQEPDVVISGNELSVELGMACKYPSSEAQIHEHVSKGYRQIDNQNLAGCVVIGLELIVFKATFDSPPKFLDFNQGGRPPQEVADECVSSAICNLVKQRTEDYPSERPIDGLIVTLSMWGAYGSPAALTGVSSWAVQCQEDNERLSDIRRVVEAAKAV